MKVTKAQLEVRIRELEAEIARLKATPAPVDPFGGIDASIPEGLIGGWKPCLVGVIAGEATKAQRKASEGRTFQDGTPVPVPLANARIKVRGAKDELDFAGIQLKLGHAAHDRDRGYRLEIPARGKGEKRFEFYKSSNGFFDSLREALIKRAEAGALAKRYAKAEEK